MDVVLYCCTPNRRLNVKVVRKVQDEDFPLDNREVEQTEDAEASSSASTPPTTAGAAVAAAMTVPIVNLGHVLARGTPQGREKTVAAAPFAKNKNDKAGKREEEQATAAKKKNKGKAFGVQSLKAVEPVADAAAPAAADKVADAPKAADAPSEASKVHTHTHTQTNTHTHTTSVYLSVCRARSLSLSHTHKHTYCYTHSIGLGLPFFCVCMFTCVHLGICFCASYAAKEEAEGY